MVVKNENTDIYYPGADESECSKTAATLVGRMGGGADQINCAMGITSMSCPALGAAPLKTAVLWNCMDLGYLAVQAGYQLASGELNKDSASITTQRLKTKPIAKDGMIVLGDALIITKDNVDQYNY